MESTNKNNTNVSRYSVELYRSPIDENTNIWTKLDDCLMELHNNGKFCLISISDSNVKYLDANIKTNNINIVAECKDDANKEDNAKINLTFKVEDAMFGIGFDERSSESANNFLKKYGNVKYSTRRTEYHSSGKVYIDGPITENGYNGLCTMHRDDEKNTIMVKGTFVNNVLDGSAEFYSDDGIVTVKCNNICDKVPNGKVIIYVNYGENGENNKHVIDASEVEDNYDILSPEFAHELCSDFVPEYESQYEKLSFNAKSIDERLSILYDKVNVLENMTMQPYQNTSFTITFAQYFTAIGMVIASNFVAKYLF